MGNETVDADEIKDKVALLREKLREAEPEYNDALLPSKQKPKKIKFEINVYYPIFQLVDFGHFEDG